MNLFIKFCIDIFRHTDRRAGYSAKVEFPAFFFMLVDKQRKAREKIKKNFDICTEKSGGFVHFFQMETDLNTDFYD